MTLDEAIVALAEMYKKVPGNTEVLDADGFALGGFKRRKFKKDDEELQCKKGDVVVEVVSQR
tara:strand:- start:350 stop:535 length:186 start_codon:yes stop_codon:yes gene_type:complete